ncbi:MAG: Hydrogenase/urease nickel incorporation protein HypA [Dehalococcoidia bacterium]|nr:Hydrogenase/urease nickel incorporation protein HypA [Bacillota bacterium]
MHEMSIARSLLDIAIAAARKGGAQRITRVNVVAGELRGIVPLQFTFYFGLLAEDTIAGGAYLNLEITPIRGRCRKCEEIFIVEDYRYICPKCRGEDIQTVGGTELRLSDIEVQ